jgi:predicted TIM-barrel enzyme
MKSNVIPVIHYANDKLALRNAEIAFDAGCEGVFLIHMEHNNRLLAPVAQVIKARWPDKLVGINYLGMAPALAVMKNITNGLDMTWTDAQLTHSAAGPWALAARVREASANQPGHLVFAGVAFKHQLDEPNPVLAAQKALEFGFIPTTSGPATGVAADVDQVATLRSAIGAEAPLAIASGITPENVGEFAPHLSHILVATGVSASYHELDFEKLYRLCSGVHQPGRKVLITPANW